MFLSYIIPIYNCKGYIANCLDILLRAMSAENFEVILVDDGSTDGSGDICAEYTRQYPNVTCFRQQNDGPATARNRGLEAAQGDFVWFVDADDAIVPQIVETLQTVVAEHPDADFVSFGYISEYPDRNETTMMTRQITACSGLEFLQRKGGGAYLWNNIYRRSSIGEHRFIDSVRHIEDFCFNHQTVIDFKKVVVLPDIGYCYNRKNVSSISHGRSQMDRDKANDDSYRVYQALYEDMRQCDDVAKRMFLENVLHFSIAAHLYTMMRFDDARTIKGYIDSYRKMGLYPLKPTGNRKSDLFIRLANHEWPFLRIKQMVESLWKMTMS